MKLALKGLPEVSSVIRLTHKRIEVLKFFRG